MAYHGPVRLSLKGDRVVAARYIRTARVLLWKLEQETAGASARRIYNLDGVTVEIVIAGRIRTATITAPTGGEGSVKIIEHFVTWPRTEDLPDGIDPEHPQLIHRVEDEVWRTLFYDASIEGYEDFERPKGQYRTEDGVPVFPEGLRHAGNVDWVGEHGVRVSWHGPSSRYFLDAYVQPRSQYGTKVFMLGQVLLDIDAYMQESEEFFDERWVLGAALSADLRTLYVVHAELPVGTTLTGTAPARTVAVYTPYPSDSPNESTSPIPTVVSSFRLSRNRENTDAMNFSVVPESREALATQTLECALHPWFFNASATHAVSVAFPLLLTATLSTAQGTTYFPPAAVNNALTYTDGAIVATPVSAAPGGEAVLAADFVGDQLRQLVVRRRPTGVPGHDDITIDGAVFAIGDAEWDMYSVAFTAPPSLVQQVTHHRALLWADIRAGVVALAHMHIAGTLPSPAVSMEIELWHGGSRVATTPMDFASLPATGLPRRIADGTRDGLRFMNQAANAPVAPLFLLYGSLVAFTGLQSLLSFPGRLGTFWTTPYPQADMFGQYVLTGTSPGPYSVIQSTSNFSTELTDFDDKLSVLGAATYEGATLFSGYDFGTRDGAALTVMYGPEPGVTLEVLTGVAGPKQRYHPIWLLGALPRTEV